MSWKKHFRAVPPVKPAAAPGGRDPVHGTNANYSSYLPEVYAGHPNRIQRYYQFDDMDRDSDVHASLDIIADFCSMSEEQTDEPFELHFEAEANDAEIRILKSMLNKWVNLNEFRSRLWYMFRNVLKNGDAFFLRDPETAEWLWIDAYMVELVKVDPEHGKTPSEYVIRALDLNKQAKFATRAADPNQYRTPMGTSNIGAGRPQSVPVSGTPMAFSLSGNNADPRQRQSLNQMLDQLTVVEARHVVHLSLSAGMDINWPFGASVLEPIFKTYKQKELLEDAIIIYRVQRAPERRIFSIDVGNMPPYRSKAYIEQIKNDIHQRRIPNRTGGGASIIDAAYNPLSVMEDYFFAVSSDGRGSKVETLPGGELTGEIGDLVFFSRKMARGLRIPASYLPLGTDEAANATQYSDGKLGQALIAEFLFAKLCMRLQSLLAPVFDREFKLYLELSGVQIEAELFSLRFNPPMTFGQYRQIEVDQAQMAVYQTVAENRRLAERFKFKRFLNLSDEEILENERLWAEENAERLRRKTGTAPGDAGANGGLAPEADLSEVGVRDFEPGPGGDLDDLAPEGEAPGGPPGGGMPGEAAGGGAAMPGGAGAAGLPAGGGAPGGAAGLPG